MSKSTSKIVLATLALGAAFAAHAFMQPDAQAPATPDKLEQLVELVALCPELTTQVAQELDLSVGMLSNDTADRLIAENKRCRHYHQQLSDGARNRLAYASLRSVVSLNVPMDERSSQATHTPQLQLSLGLSRGS